jgi:hypothetical protein
MARNRHLASRSLARRSRRAVAVVELAVCLPILVVILVATIETCVMLQLQQNLVVTAYEGARVGVIPGIEADTVHQQCVLLLDDRSVHGYTITLTPADPSTLDPGDSLTVTIAAPCSANSLLGSVFYADKTITESVVMLAE